MDNNALVKQILAIQQDPSLTEGEKARKRQQLMSSRWTTDTGQGSNSGDEDGEMLGFLLASWPLVPHRSVR